MAARHHPCPRPRLRSRPRQSPPIPIRCGSPRRRQSPGRPSVVSKRAGDDRARTSPVSVVGPGSAALLRGLQRNRVSRRDCDAQRLADQDSVGHSHVAIMRAYDS
jgi:hypothetical protein